MNEDRTDRTEAAGFYTAGSLVNAMDLPPESSAHLKIFRLRNRGWATKTLVDTIIKSAASFKALFPVGDRVQVGDIASEYGGDLSLHASHQNGLDADIAYLQTDHVERDPNVWGKQGFEEVFVQNGKLTKNFDFVRNWALFKELVASGVVSRIFVGAEIKRAYCLNAPKIGRRMSKSAREDILRRLRPYPNHDDHFHLRIRCPATNKKCENQSEPPQGSGCNTIDLVDFSEHEV